jgi:hypothetical protein
MADSGGTKIVVIVWLILLIISSIIYIDYSSTWDNDTRSRIYKVNLNQTKLEDGYLLTICGAYPEQIPVNSIRCGLYRWEFYEGEERRIILIEETFPQGLTLYEIETKSYDNYYNLTTYSYYGTITISWQDNDYSQKLSKEDTIRLIGPKEYLEGYVFFIDKIPGNPRWVGEIELI